MIKPVALFCLVLVASVSCIYDEELESKFLPINREISETDNYPVSPFKSLNGLDKGLLAKIKSISIIEFENDEKKTDNKKSFQIIDWTMDLQNKDNEHDIKKRAISHKYKAAALAFYGSILKDTASLNGKYSMRHKGTPRHRGKRATSAFEKPSLGNYNYGYHLIPTSYTAPAPTVPTQTVPEPQPQPMYSAPVPAVPEPQPQPMYSAPVPAVPEPQPQPMYSSYNSYQSQDVAPKMELPNNCNIGFTEPIYQGVDVTETYCRCPSGTYGLNCQENFNNPCSYNGGQYHPADPSIGPHYFIECNWNTPYLFKCPANLVWNQQKETCDWQFFEAAPSASPAGYSAYQQPAY